MKREFSINIALLLIINLLIKPIYIFGIETQVQNVVGIENYGLYFAYFNFVFLFQFINDPGLQTWNAQYVPKNQNLINDYFPNLLTTKLLLAFIFFPLVMIIGSIIGFGDMKLVMVLSLNLVLSSLFMIMRTTMSGLGHYRTDSWISALDKVLMIIIIGGLMAYQGNRNSFTIMTFVYGQCVSYIISCFIASFLLLSKIQINFLSIKIESIKYILRSSLPYVLTLLFMSAYNKLDGIMLGNLLDDGNYQAGVYASAYRFYDAANMTGYLFAALLLPMFGANIFDKKMLEELTGIGLRYILVSSIVVVSVIFFYGENILQFLYKDYESTFDIVLKILIVSYVAVAVAYVYGTLLVAAGKIRNLNVVFGIGLLVNVVLNLVLIPKYQAIGAAIATMITQTFVMLGQIFLVDKEMYIRMSASDLKKPLIFILISTSVFYLVKQIFLGSWIYNLAASLLFCLLLSFIFKIIEKQDFFSLKNRNE